MAAAEAKAISVVGAEATGAAAMAEGVMTLTGNLEAAAAAARAEGVLTLTGNLEAAATAARAEGVMTLTGNLGAAAQRGANLAREQSGESYVTVAFIVESKTIRRRRGRNFSNFGNARQTLRIFL